MMAKIFDRSRRTERRVFFEYRQDFICNHGADFGDQPTLWLEVPDAFVDQPAYQFRTSFSRQQGLPRFMFPDVWS